MRGMLNRNSQFQYLMPGQPSVRNLRKSFARLAFETLFSCIFFVPSGQLKKQVYSSMYASVKMQHMMRNVA